MPQPMGYHTMLRKSETPENQVSSRAILNVVDSTMAYSERSLAGSLYSSSSSRVANLFGTNHKGVGAIPLSVVTANSQTAGTGRLGRQWSDKSEKSLAASFITAMPNDTVSALGAGWLTTMAGLCVLDSLRAMSKRTDVSTAGRGLGLKWPNDIFVEGRKLGGILSRLVVQSDGFSAIVFGIGLNLFMGSDDVPIADAASLHKVYPPLVSVDYETVREWLVADIAASFNGWLTKASYSPQSTREELRIQARQRSVTIGRTAHVRVSDGSSFEGHALDIDTDAALLVELDDGSLRRVTTADVGVS